MELPKGDRLAAETLSYSDWRSDPRYAEGDDIIYKAYVALHGRDSDYSSPKYAESLEKDNTITRLVSSLSGRIEAVWHIKRDKEGGFLKARSGAPRRSDLDSGKRIPIYAQLLDVANEEDLPIVVEPDLRVQALSDTLDVLGLSTVWCEEELQRVMGGEYACTHEFIGLNKYGQARFKVKNALGHEFERRAYVLYPQRMVKPKTIVRVMGVLPALTIEGEFSTVGRSNYIAMLQKDPLRSQTKQGGLWEFPGGNVDQREKKPAAAIREFLEETGIDLNVLGAELKKAGTFTYQFFHREGVFEPKTTVFKATLPRCNLSDAPQIQVVKGSNERHQGGSWFPESDVMAGKVALTRASNLMRQRAG